MPVDRQKFWMNKVYVKTTENAREYFIANISFHPRRKYVKMMMPGFKNHV